MRWSSSRSKPICRLFAEGNAMTVALGLLAAPPAAIRSAPLAGGGTGLDPVATGMITGAVVPFGQQRLHLPAQCGDLGLQVLDAGDHRLARFLAGGAVGDEFLLPGLGGDQGRAGLD